MPSDPREEFRFKERPARASQVLRDFTETLSTERVSIEEIVAALGDRGLGVLIAIFAVPNILPSTVPFGNVGTGLPVIFLAVHLMAGWPRLVLPRFLAKLSVSAPIFRKFAPTLASVLSYFEGLLRPRFLSVTGPVAERGDRRPFPGACHRLDPADPGWPQPAGHRPHPDRAGPHRA